MPLLWVSLKREGILPKIKPAKIYFNVFSKLENKQFKIFPNRNTPITIPINIGNKNKKFFLKSLNIFKILSINFSYIPKTTHKTPLLIPGKMQPCT